MDPRLSKLLAATVMFSYWLAGAQAVGEPTQARPVDLKAGARAATPHAQKKEAKPESRSCSRGTWKDSYRLFRRRRKGWFASALGKFHPAQRSAERING